jgi:hypothetical protein
MNAPHKVGVLTFHRCINYGSYWQARCLVEALRTRGHDAVILDHHSRRVNIAEWKCAFRPVLPTPVPQSDYPLYRQKIQKFFTSFCSLPLSRPFALENPSDMEPCDLVVVGSDEVWNLRHPWYGTCALFFGSGVRAPRLVSYAASFGNYHAEWGLDPVWADQLCRFDAISVRDDNSRAIINTALGFDPALVLDPCLQFVPQPAGDWHAPSRPFVAVYGHNFSDSFIREVQRWAKARGYLLVSIGYRNDWADQQWITAGPDEFAHAMKHAEAVATNFFHGCVFALRNARPFVCETSFYRSNKIRCLMAMIGGEQHIASENTPAAVYDTCLGEPLAAELLRTIEHFRKTSETFLDQALA